MPLVSVIMPCFNHARYVEESIKSVLNQTERDLELILVDDGSTDGSPEVIEATSAGNGRVKPLYHPTNQGASHSRNDGLNHATGEYVAFCDADDLWLPEKLEKQLELFSRFPVVDIAYSDTKIINSAGEETGALFSDRFPVPGSGNGNLFYDLCVRNFINMQSALVRRKAIHPENYFDPNIRWVEDWLFWIKLARNTSFIYSPEPLGLYRVHEGSSAATQAQGLIQNRIKVYTQILGFADRLPRRVLSEIFYRMGVGLAQLKQSEAKRSYADALMHNPLHWKAAVRLLLSYARA
jgi:glycosyltransferase involved in cell wall biosynthesis